jgi:DNA mismatch endonuclease (patch repair protein)
MPDIVSPEKRSEMMRGIRSKDTKPELVIRQGLHREGFRYRLHARGVPGKPDLVFPKYHAVIFVHGCFWHGHDCHLFKWPKTRTEFWHTKIRRNRERDLEVRDALHKAGWRILTVYECALKGRTRLAGIVVIRRCAMWLRADSADAVIEGLPDSQTAN